MAVDDSRQDRQSAVPRDDATPQAGVMSRAGAVPRAGATSWAGAMPRAGLPRDSARSESVIRGVAYLLAIVFAAAQVLTILAAAPASIALSMHQAGAPTGIIALLDTLGPTGIFLSLAAIDLSILYVLVRLARRHWIGFVFLAPMLYLGIGFVVLWPMFVEVIKWAASRG